MTNPTPHGQVPEALIDLIDAYAETRHRCGGIYNAKTEAARKAVIEALSGVQALSAAPAAKKSALRTYPNPIVPLIKPVSEQEKMRALYLASSNLMAYLGRNGAIHSDGHAADAMMDCLNDLDGGGFDETLFAASPTPPAEQQAQPDECFPGEPKVAVPQGLISAACFAIRNKRDGGKVLEQLRRYSVGDRSQPLAPQQAAPKAAPGDVLDEALRERDEAEDFINELLDEVLGADRPEWSSAYNRYDAMSDVRERITALHKPAVDKAWGQFQSAMAAPQQEAQEPGEIPESIERMATGRYKVVPSHESMFHRWAVVAGSGTQQLYLGREVECQNMARKFAGAFLDGAFVAMQSTAPQPAPAPLSRDQIREVFMAHGFTIKEGQTDLKQYVYDAAYALLTLAAPPTAQAEGWRPISTAPRDGREVLAYTAGLGRVVVYFDDEESQWGTGLGYLHYDEPTHWTPLPPPPTSAEGVDHG